MSVISDYVVGSTEPTLCQTFEVSGTISNELVTIFDIIALISPADPMTFMTIRARAASISKMAAHAVHNISL